VGSHVDVVGLPLLCAEESLSFKSVNGLSDTRNGILAITHEVNIYLFFKNNQIQCASPRSSRNRNSPFLDTTSNCWASNRSRPTDPSASMPSACHEWSAVFIAATETTTATHETSGVHYCRSYNSVDNFDVTSIRPSSCYDVFSGDTCTNMGLIHWQACPGVTQGNG
jgi:hypothetical protein